MRKVYVTVLTRLIIQKDDDIGLSKVIDELEYDFRDTTGKADIVDQEIWDYNILDSK